MTSSTQLIPGSADDEMSVRTREFCWEETPVGPVETWPQSLRTAVGIMLASKFPMYIAWGPEYTQFYNTAYRPILGARHPDALGKSSAESFPEIWDIMQAMFSNVMEMGIPSYFEGLLAVLERYGYLEETYFDFCYSAIYHEDGHVGGVFVTCRETTDRVVAERRLQTSRNLLDNSIQARTVAQAISHAIETFEHNRLDLPFAAIYLTDAGGDQLALAGTSGVVDGHSLPARVNARSETLFGVDVLGLTKPGDGVFSLASFEADLLPSPWGEKPERGVVLPLPKADDGSERGVLVVGFSPRLRDDDAYLSFLETVVGHVSMSLTSARAYEEAQARANALEELDRLKSDFFSNISYEFRTPLTLTLDPLSRLLDGDLGPLRAGQRRELSLIQRNSLRLLKLVNMLLDFTRVQALGYPVAPRPTDIASYTRQLADVFRSVTESAGLDMVVDCDTFSEPVLVDVDIWEKVVLNLLLNAFKFTFVGEIRLGLREESQHLVLEISDTGVGIAQADLPHLFERFYRVSNQPARSHEGAGIGLALVADLVEAHGGTMTVESAVGLGTTFTVRLPLETVRIPAEAARALPVNSRNRLAFSLEAEDWLANRAAQTGASGAPVDADTSARILVVDASAQMRDYLTRILSPHWQVEVTGDGQSALEAIIASPPDLVLADVIMPRLDGLSLVRELRRHPDTALIPIVLLTAQAGNDLSMSGLDIGVDDYIAKPFLANELVARISTRLHMHAARRRIIEAQEAERNRNLVAEIVEGVHDPFFVVDLSRRLIYLNTAAEPLWEGKRAEVVNLSVSLDLAETVAGRYVQHYFDALSREQPAESVVALEVWGRWYEVRVFPFSQGYSFYWVDVTERKQAEETQQQTQHLLQTILDTLPVGVWVADADGKLFLNNPAGYSIWGGAEYVKPDQYTVYRGWDVETGQQLTSESWGMARALKGQSSLNQMVEILAFDGQRKILLNSAVPIRDDLGKIMGGVVVNQDVTAWQRAEQLARVQHAFAKAISDITALLVSSLDLDTVMGHILTNVERVVPHEAARIFLIQDGKLEAAYGHDASDRPDTTPPRAIVETTYKRLQTIFAATEPVLVPEIDPLMRDWLQNADTRAAVVAPIRLKETTFGYLVLESAMPGFFKQDDVARLGVFADQAAIAIDNAKLYSAVRAQAIELEQRVAQRTAELNRSKEHVEAILNSSSDGIALVTEHGVIEQINPAFGRVFGLRGPLGTLHAEQFVVPEDMPLVREQAAHALATGQPVQLEILCRRAGEAFYAEVGLAALSQHDQPFRSLVCTVRDISLRKRVEEDLRRTLQKEQELSRLKSHFVSTVSHEFRTPLAIIQTSSDLLLRYVDRLSSERRSETLERIQTEVIHLRELLDELLTHYKAEAIGLDLKITAIHLPDFSERIIRQVCHAFPGERQVQSWYSAACDEIEIDVALFERVLTNLLSNALKYSSDDKPVEFHVRCVEGEATIEIRDYGIGIPADSLEQLFEPFYRADNVGATPGTGLGLSIVKSVVDAHRGKITVESKLNAGSTFRITLPTRQASVAV